MVWDVDVNKGSATISAGSSRALAVEGSGVFEACRSRPPLCGRSAGITSVVSGVHNLGRARRGGGVSDESAGILHFSTMRILVGRAYVTSTPDARRHAYSERRHVTIRIRNRGKAGGGCRCSSSRKPGDPCRRRRGHRSPREPARYTAVPWGSQDCCAPSPCRDVRSGREYRA